MSEPKVRSEEFKIQGDMILNKIKELVQEGNIRRIIIKDEEGKSLIDIPLTAGIAGAIFAPKLAAIGAILAMTKHGTIVVEKIEEA
jgi:hypothetical protein